VIESVRIRTIGAAMRELTLTEAKQIVGSRGWLAHLPQAFRERVLDAAVLMTFSPNEPVFRFGDPLGGIYGLARGSVTINASPSNETPRLIQLGIPGAWAGEGCFMTGQPRRVEIRALSEAWLMHVPLREMERLASLDAKAVRAFAAISIFSIDMLFRIVHDLQKRSASRRIASTLDRAAWNGNEPIPLSQADIGIMANASRQQVNAALQRFEKAGWLTNAYRSIAINDVEALRRFAGQGGEG
jgi:CRP/FNR family transcriptional regulator, cyclic AMP receptor protein